MLEHDLSRFLSRFALWAVLWAGSHVYMEKHSGGTRSGLNPLLLGTSWLRQALMFVVAIPLAIAGTIVLFTGLNDPDWIEAAAIAGGTAAAGLAWVLWRYRRRAT